MFQTFGNTRSKHSSRVAARAHARGDRRFRAGRAVAVAALLAALLPVAATAADAPAASDSTFAGADLTQIRLEDLMSLQVTSVSRHQQRLSDIAGAVTVITQDQIRASGATTLAEVLRLVPGLQVAQIDANMWSISARGFSGRIANKLLLLVDGRTVYSPLFSGVYWDEQDLMLEDIDRIEVIRGPGASMWGANAVNGVINVITRDAHDSKGSLVSGFSGNEELGGGSARWSGPIGAGGAIRVFARGATRASGAIPGRRDAWDSWQGLHGGFRADLSSSAVSRWTVSGDLRGGDAGQALDAAMSSPPYSLHMEPRTRSTGSNLVANWRRTISPRSEVTVLGYVDVSDRRDDVLKAHIETYDLEFKHHASSGSHDLVWGVEGRAIRDRLDNTAVLFFDPARELRGQVGAFAQDEMTVADRRLHLTVGARLDETHTTGLEWQPTGRVLWSPDGRRTLWAAVSRAVRTPSRAENDIRYHVATLQTGGPPAVVTMYGDPNFRSETLVAYETGYRWIPGPGTMVDLAAFYNDYARLRTIEPGASTFVPGPSPYVDVQEAWANKMHGDTRGLEASAEWSVTRSWKLVAGASCLAMRLHLDPDSRDVGSVGIQGNEPRYQLMTQSQFHPAGRWTWDATVYQVASRSSQHVRAYTRLDLGLSWRATDAIELNVTGKNLLQRRHFEDDGVYSGVLPTEVERSVIARFTVQL